MPGPTRYDRKGRPKPKKPRVITGSGSRPYVPPASSGGRTASEAALGRSMEAAGRSVSRSSVRPSPVYSRPAVSLIPTVDSRALLDPAGSSDLLSALLAESRDRPVMAEGGRLPSELTHQANLVAGKGSKSARSRSKVKLAVGSRKVSSGVASRVRAAEREAADRTEKATREKQYPGLMKYFTGKQRERQNLKSSLARSKAMVDGRQVPLPGVMWREAGKGNAPSGSAKELWPRAYQRAKLRAAKVEAAKPKDKSTLGKVWDTVKDVSGVPSWLRVNSSMAENMNGSIPGLSDVSEKMADRTGRASSGDYWMVAGDMATAGLGGGLAARAGRAGRAAESAGRAGRAGREVGPYRGGPGRPPPRRIRLPELGPGRPPRVSGGRVPKQLPRARGTDLVVRPRGGPVVRYERLSKSLSKSPAQLRSRVRAGRELLKRKDLSGPMRRGVETEVRDASGQLERMGFRMMDDVDVRIRPRRAGTSNRSAARSTRHGRVSEHLGRNRGKYLTGVAVGGAGVGYFGGGAISKAQDLAGFPTVERQRQHRGVGAYRRAGLDGTFTPSVATRNSELDRLDRALSGKPVVPGGKPLSHREQVVLAKQILAAKARFRSSKGGKFRGEANEIANALLKLGYSPKAAAGITGNAYQESSYNPGAVEPGTPNGGLWGFTAGEKSMASLRAFAEANGLDPSKVSTQAKFMDSTMPDDLRQRLNAAASPEDAALMFSQEWERPGIPMNENRTAAAGRVMTGLRTGNKRGNPELKAKWHELVGEGRKGGVYDRPLGADTYPLASKGKIIASAADHGDRPFGNWMSDNAVDIATPIGTPVKAVADGVISRVSGSTPNHAGNPAGWTVYLTDKNGREFSYMHLDGYKVKPGQKVKAGETLGRSGAANGVAHLHFAVNRGNPARELKGKGGDPNSPFVSFSPKGPGSSSIPGKLEADPDTTLTFQKPFAEALLRLATLSGEPIQFNEARRTRDRQQFLVDHPEARSGPAAAAGTSNHEGGAAADIALTPKQTALLGQAGLARPVGGEPWHVELADSSKVMSTPQAYAAGIEQAEGENGSLGLSVMGRVKANSRAQSTVGASGAGGAGSGPAAFVADGSAGSMPGEQMAGGGGASSYTSSILPQEYLDLVMNAGSGDGSVLEEFLGSPLKQRKRRGRA